MTFVSGKYELEQKLYLKLFILKNLQTFVSTMENNYAHDIYS